MQGLRLMLQWKNVRDVVLFGAGLAGVFHETVIAVTERPTLLLLFAAMMGLPAFLRTDERNGNGSSSRDKGLELMRRGIEEEKEHR